MVNRNRQLGALEVEVRERLGPTPALDDMPLVSVVVLNRDGEEHLRRLLAGLVERTDYPSFELIVVDNGSSDGSVDFLREVEAPFPVSILANPNNESFSDANNQGAAIAAGELLLFLNNDVEPLERGWLRELIASWKTSAAGAVGARLVYADDEASADSGYRAQEQEVRLRERDGVIAGAGGGPDPELFGKGFGENREAGTVIGACTLVESGLFNEVGGFTHGYFYGAEDIDLVLKLRERGRKIVNCGRSLLVHHVSATTLKLLGDPADPARRGNRMFLLRRWGPRLWREVALGQLDGGNLWTAETTAPPGSPSRAEILALGFCLRADGLGAGEALPDAVTEIEAELGRRGHRHDLITPGAAPGVAAYMRDVAVYLRGPRRHVPAPGQLNVLWALGDMAELTGLECRRYGLAVTDDPVLAARLGAGSGDTPVIALDPDRTAASLLDAVLSHAAEIELPTRIGRSAEQAVQRV